MAGIGMGELNSSSLLTPPDQVRPGGPLTGEPPPLTCAGGTVRPDRFHVGIWTPNPSGEGLHPQRRCHTVASPRPSFYSTQQAVVAWASGAPSHARARCAYKCGAKLPRPPQSHPSKAPSTFPPFSNCPRRTRSRIMLHNVVVLLGAAGGVLAAIGPVTDLAIVNKVIAPDGVPRDTVLAGGTFPGPLIQGHKVRTSFPNASHRNNRDHRAHCDAGRPLPH